METETGEARIVEAEGRRGQEGNRKKARRTRKKKAKEKEGSRSKKSTREVGDLGRGRESSKVRREGKETSFWKVLSENKSIWQETIEENAHTKDLGPCHWYERRVCAKKEEGIPIIKGRKRGSTRIYIEIIEERVYLTLKVASNSISVLCRKEEWEKENGTELLVS